MATIRDITARRTAQILIEDRDADAPPVVAVRALSDLQRHLVHGAARVEEISAGELKAAILWREAPDRHSLWVRATYAGYRTAYRTFIGRVYQDVDWSGFPEFDVDHLLNRARIRRLDYYLRVEAVQKEINQQHGRTIERASGQNPREKATRKAERPLTAISILKLAGIEAPRGPEDVAALARAKAFLVGSQRWEAAAAEMALQNMVHDAYEVR